VVSAGIFQLAAATELVRLPNHTYVYLFGKRNVAPLIIRKPPALRSCRIGYSICRALRFGGRGWGGVAWRSTVAHRGRGGGIAVALDSGLALAFWGRGVSWCGEAMVTPPQLQTVGGDGGGRRGVITRRSSEDDMRSR
jgi:hypothetical protein